METKDFKTEWCLLQNQYDSYEKHSLYIKLLSVIITTTVVVSGAPSIFTLLLVLVLWLQDGIWKTFQSRIEPRLMQIEKHIAEGSEAPAFQFNSEYQSARLSGSSLVREYIRQAVRPTVAFPYLVLMGILSAQWVL